MPRWSRREEAEDRIERIERTDRSERTDDRFDRGEDRPRSRWEQREKPKPESRDGSLQPLPRPGYDEDKRLQKLNDDPRYHPGAELGKAQKAAMGIKGLHGRNTASFDPRSTLVRPAMRIIYGRKGHELGSTTKPDDVVVVPELICELGDHSVASRVIAELKKSAAELDPKTLPSIGSLTARMCQYFQVDHKDALVRVRWHQAANSPALELQSTGFSRKDRTNRRGCMLHLSLGVSCELAFKRLRTGEVVYFPQCNGTLTLLGCDIDTKWYAGESKVPEGMNVLISVWGTSSKAEEDHLAETVSIATKARSF